MNSSQKKAEAKSFNKPEEVRTFPKGKVELITIGGATIGRATLEPGWKWSTSVQPLAKTKSCEAPHFQYHVSGTLKIVMDDGTQFECKAGDVSLLPGGHDAWVVGNEPVVLVDFQGMAEYAKGSKKQHKCDKNISSYIRRCVMRFLLKVNIPVDAGNVAAKAGKLGGTIQQILGDLKPEAVSRPFLLLHTRRCGLLLST
jgi:hypothetical protein